MSCQPEKVEKSKEAKETMPPAPPTAFEDPPEWSKRAVWYQIFPERFYNGDPSNDPRPEDIAGSYPGFVPDGWQVTPWTQDWYQDDAYWHELVGKQDVFGNDLSSFGQKSQLRRYGGDLQGVLDKMDYLVELGVTAVYFNPLNDAPSLHKYDARNWRHIDRNFGPDPAGDVSIMEGEVPDDPSTWKFTAADQLFLEVIRTFHRYGIKVILDYSWNHTGKSFWAWKDLETHQAASTYADWYWIEQFDDPQTEDNEFKYRGWLGVPSLPEIKETEFQDHTKAVKVFEGDVFQQKAKEHIFQVTTRWLDPNQDGDPSDGVDGFRLDVAAEMPLGFWRDYRKLVRGINPDAFLLGEIWWEEWPDKLLDPEVFVKGDVFDAPMNYRWFRAARHFFNAAPEAIPVSEFVDSLNSFRSNLRPQSNYAMMNLMASHDVPRVATALFNKNKYKVNSNPFGSNEYRINKPDQQTRETLLLMLVHQFTYIGAPHIWAGDEMGMWGADDPCCRKPLIWPEFEFDPESVHPTGKERPEDEVRFDEELFSAYRALIRLRKQHPALVSGDIEFVKVDDGKEILAYSRFDDQQEVLVVFNTGSTNQIISLPAKFNGNYRVKWGTEEPTRSGSSLQVELGARQALVLVSP